MLNAQELTDDRFNGPEAHAVIDFTRCVRTYRHIIRHEIVFSLSSNAKASLSESYLDLKKLGAQRKLPNT